ncbi:ATP-binding cassette domain-containing protein [Nonomuraea fuscirosea]|uniref:ABC transporter ATP-binding protein n=1 Tax=Nonomuraea fuscirosea TaxID=1291556 RepID=UPI003713FDED
MISTTHLSRTFRAPGGEEVRAVRGIDLSVARGETVAVLGPNGAGKSTLMRMLSTLLPPTGGTARVAGFDVRTQAPQVRERIGYVGQGHGAGHAQRAVDEVVTQGRIHGLDRAAARARAAELLAALGLERLARRRTQAMSGGQRRRLDLAIGLVHLPELLFLDEPTTGLDPQNRDNLWEHIIGMRRRGGTTVVFSTHYLEEADRRADRIVVVDHGRVIADGTPAQLKQRHAGDRLTLETADPASAERLRGLVAAMDGVGTVTRRGAVVTGRAADGRAALPSAIVAARDQGITVVAADTRLPTLDDVFLELTGRSLRDAGEDPGTGAEERGGPVTGVKDREGPTTGAEDREGPTTRTEDRGGPATGVEGGDRVPGQAA